MRPKGKLLALLAIFAAIGLVTATGAFTTVTAERTMDVEVAGDANALLQMTPSNTANGDYADDSGDTIVIDFENLGDVGPGAAQGINENAITDFHTVFNITNQGNQDVRVWIEHTTNTFDDSRLVIYNATDTSEVIEAQGDGVVLSPGEQLSVGIRIDTRGGQGLGTFSETLTVNADAEAV